MESLKLYPRCLPKWFDEDGNEIYKSPKYNRPITFTSNGYVLPCAWSDSTLEDEEYFRMMGFFDKKLEDYDSLEEMLNDDHWKEFIDIIQTEPEFSAPCCKRKCTNKGNY